MIYSPNDVARETGINVNTITRWLREGRFPAQKIGCTWAMTEDVYQTVLAEARQRVGNRRPRTVNSEWTRGTFQLQRRGRAYRRERLARAIREVQRRQEKHGK